VASSPASERRSKRRRFRAFMAQPMRQSKSGIYYLRRKVPDDLREALGREYKRSLKTRDPSEAKVRFAEAFISCERVFALARAQATGEATYSRAEAQQLAARWFRAEQERMDQTGEFAGLLAQGPTTWVETEEGLEEAVSFESLRSVANADPTIDLRAVAQKVLGRAMRREGLPVPPQGSTAHQGLLNAFEEHLDKLSAWALERHYGEQVSRGVGVAPWAPIEAERRAEAAAKPKERTLLDLFGKYSERKKLDDGDDRSTRKTLKEYRGRVDDFIELHGNLEVGEIPRELVAEHRGLLAKLPSKGTGIRGLMAPQLIEKADKESLPRLSAQTIRNRLRALSAVLSYGKQLGWVQENVVIESGMAKAAAKAARQGVGGRKYYTHGELRTIFTSPVFSSTDWLPPRGDFGRAWYWLPLLLYYTGARREELAQLAVTDVQEDADAGWFLNIAASGDKTLKTKASERVIPLHPDLVKRGFIDYAQQQSPSGLLFPKLVADPKGYFGANFGKHWASYLRDTVRLKSPASPSHGFRHTFKTLCREAGIPEDVHDAITGHAGEGRVARGYGTMPLTRKAEEIRRLPVVPMTTGPVRGRS
jgi:integrase